MLTKKALIVSLLCVLVSVEGAFEFNNLIQVITNYCKIHQMNSFILIYNKHSLNPSETNEIQGFLHNEIQVPTILVSTQTRIGLRKLVNQPTISLVFCKDANAIILNLTDKTLTGIHYSRIIFVMRGTPTLGTMKEIFEWCWTRGMVNVLLLYTDEQGHSQVFTYQPFPKIILENVTEILPKDLFPDKLINFKGYNFRSPLRQDAPRVFKYKNSKDQNVYAGIGVKIFLNFVKKFNGTFQEIDVAQKTNTVDMSELLRLIDKKVIDISVHPYGNFDRRVYGASYPFLKANWCFVVPVVGELPAFMYLILPFDGTVWDAIGAGILYISAMKYACTFKHERHPEFGHILSCTICGILYIPIPMKLSEFSVHNLLFYGQLFLLGFILSNLYVSSLTSFLTTTVYGPQLDTLEKIYLSGLKIMTIGYEKLSIIAQDNFNPEYTSMFLIVDADTFSQHRNNLNTTYGYPMTTERWQFFLQQQKYRKTPLFHISELCFGYYHVAFPAQFDSPFIEPLSIFIMQVNEHGLYSQWQESTFDEAFRAGILRVLYNSESVYKPLTVEDLKLLWVVYGIGVTCSAIGFILEHVRCRMKIKCFPSRSCK